jgi:hypothetical protein
MMDESDLLLLCLFGMIGFWMFVLGYCFGYTAGRCAAARGGRR